MPLTLLLKPKERLFINGAVIENGETKSSITVLNDVSVLREKDILTEQTADTPCKQIYLTVQLMYMDDKELTTYHKIYWELVRDVIQAAPSTTATIQQISEHILDGQYYQALKVAKHLIDVEKEIMSHAK